MKGLRTSPSMEAHTPETFRSRSESPGCRAMNELDWPVSDQCRTPDTITATLPLDMHRRRRTCSRENRRISQAYSAKPRVGCAPPRAPSRN